MKKIIVMLLPMLIGCNDIPSQGKLLFLRKEANLGHLMRTNAIGDDCVRTFFRFTVNCFIDTNTLAMDSCLVLTASGIDVYEYPAFLKVQIKSSEDTVWNSILSYLSFNHSDKNLGWMVQPKGYYEDSEFIPSDTILVGDKNIPQKSLGVFEFEIRDSFGNRIKIGLNLRSRLPRVSKNSMGNLELRWPSDSLPTAVCIASLCDSEDGCSSPLRILQVDSSVREEYSWFDFCLSGNETEKIAIPDSSYLEKYGNYIAKVNIDLPEITVETDCKKGVCVEDDIRQLFESRYYIYYK